MTTALALASALITACGSGDSKSQDDATAAVSEVASLEGPDREQTLKTVAAEEGEVSIYTAMGQDDFNTFTAGFNELYPDIKVTVFSGTGEKAVQRALTEYQAGQHSVDVIFGPTTDIGYLAKAGYLQQYASPNIPEGTDQEALAGVPVYVNRFVLAWNTNRVSANEIPSSYQDLVDP